MIRDFPVVVFACSFLDVFVKLSLILILLCQKNIYKNIRFWLATLLLSFYGFGAYMITDSAIRIILLFAVTIVSVFFILKFDKKYLKRIIYVTFFVWLVMALMDVLYTILFEVVLKLNLTSYRNNAYMVFFMNNVMILTVVICFSFKNVQNFIKKILNIDLSKNNYIFVVIILSVILFSVIFYFCQFNYKPIIVLIVSFIMVVIYTIIVIITIREFSLKHKIQSEYDALLTNLSEYENLLDRQRILNHENKNQLLVIKGMINKKEEKVSEYIDTIIDTQYLDNENLIMTTNRIPSGGLRGLIYYKMLGMKDKNINVNLEVDSNLRNLDFTSIPIRTNQELCKIVGVFLDNAIQAVDELEIKKINILLQYEKCLIIKISNNYKGAIDLDKLDNRGYTTKGNGHGYGLCLVKNIIKNNELFENTKEINGKMFTQVIKLKIKTD